MNLQAKARVKELVAQGPPPKRTFTQKEVEDMDKMYQQCMEGGAAISVPDELVIELTGNGTSATVTLRPSEVSRLRGRFGRGPGFEQWVAARIRDAMISFGGG